MLQIGPVHDGHGFTLRAGYSLVKPFRSLVIVKPPSVLAESLMEYPGCPGDASDRTCARRSRFYFEGRVFLGEAVSLVGDREAAVGPGGELDGVPRMSWRCFRSDLCTTVTVLL